MLKVIGGRADKRAGERMDGLASERASRERSRERDREPSQKIVRESLRLGTEVEPATGGTGELFRSISGANR